MELTQDIRSLPLNSLSRYLVVINNMSSSTFPRFLELPEEPQIHIWEPAIDETGHFTSSHTLLPTAGVFLLRSVADHAFGPVDGESLYIGGAYCRGHKSLFYILGAGRPSRELVLMEWKKRLEGLDGAYHF